MLPPGYQFQSETVRKSVEQGLEQGRAQGLEQGRAQGLEQGRAQGEARAVVRFLEARGLAVSEAQRERILSTLDLELLETWIHRAATVATVDALFE